VPGASVGGASAGGASDAPGFGGAAVASSEARIREIGGKTSRLVFGSASSVFLRDFFRSINETLSTSWKPEQIAALILAAELHPIYLLQSRLRFLAMSLLLPSSGSLISVQRTACEQQ
jgi:hypothetical protein